MGKAQKTAVIAVIIGSLLFGALGICTRFYSREYGLSPIDIVFIRLTFSALGLLIILLILARDQLKIRKKDIPFLMIFGLFKFLTDVLFFFSQQNVSLCLATLLQMTAPYFVMVLSLILFREKITMPKLFAMGVGTIGCILVTNVLFGPVDNLRWEGVVAAVLSGLCISLFFIGNRMAIDRDILPTTMLLYTTLAADLFACILFATPYADIGNTFNALATPAGFGVALAFGLIMTLVPYYILTWSCLYIEPTIVSMISVLEVAAAAVVGYLVFGEAIDIPHILGIGLVIMSIVLINIKIRMDYIKRYGKYVSPFIKLGLKPFAFIIRPKDE